MHITRTYAPQSSAGAQRSAAQRSATQRNATQRNAAQRNGSTARVVIGSDLLPCGGSGAKGGQEQTRGTRTRMTSAVQPRLDATCHARHRAMPSTDAFPRRRRPMHSLDAVGNHVDRAYSSGLAVGALLSRCKKAPERPVSAPRVLFFGHEVSRERALSSSSLPTSSSRSASAPHLLLEHSRTSQAFHLSLSSSLSLSLPLLL